MKQVDWKMYELAYENNKLNKGYYQTEEYKRYDSIMKVIDSVNFILSKETDKMDLLDVGCGAAWQAVCFKKENITGINYHGLDVSQHMCDFGKENYPEGEFFTADIETDDLGKQFDIVMESAVVELTGDWKKCVAGMMKHSKKWLIFHRMFFTDDKTRTEQTTTYNDIPDIRIHVGLNDLNKELSKQNFSIIRKDIWKVNDEYKMGTFIARRK
jgi:SAM-dependent methyltransferase